MSNPSKSNPFSSEREGWQITSALRHKAILASMNKVEELTEKFESLSPEAEETAARRMQEQAAAGCSVFMPEQTPGILPE